MPEIWQAGAQRAKERVANTTTLMATRKIKRYHARVQYEAKEGLGGRHNASAGLLEGKGLGLGASVHERWLACDDTHAKEP